MIYFRHAGIVITNRKRSLRFYCDLLGLKIYREMHEAGDFVDSILGLKKVKVNTIKLSADGNGGLVELLSFSSHPKKMDTKRKIFSVGPSHIALTVDNLDTIYKKLLKAKVPFTSAPLISDDGSAKVTFCKDPDGNFVELVQILKKK